MKAEAAPSPCAEPRGTSGWGTSAGALTARPWGLTWEILASPRCLAAPAPSGTLPGASQLQGGPVPRSAVSVTGFGDAPPTPGLLCACLCPPRSPGHGDGPSDVPLGSPAWPNLVLTQGRAGPALSGATWRPEIPPAGGGRPLGAAGILNWHRGQRGLGLSPSVWAGRSPSWVVRGMAGGRPPSPALCGGRQPQARRGDGLAKGRAAGRPWAGLSPPPALELGAQPGRHLPWGRLVNPDGPSRQNRPSPDPSARRRPPTNSLGGLVLDRVSPEMSPQCGHLPRGRQRDAGPTWQWAPGLPGGHCGSPAPAVPRGHLVCEAAGGEVPRGPYAPCGGLVPLLGAVCSQVCVRVH